MSGETQDTIEGLLREYRSDALAMDRRELPQPTTQYIRIFCDRIEAVARRAYKEIDLAVCFIEDAASCEIDDVRRAMENTLGDYYE